MSQSVHASEAIPARAGDPKLQRWVDLLAALLARRGEVTFDELVRDVPDYDWPDTRGVPDAERAPLDRRRASTKRKFERDKEELRAFGIPLESVPDEAGNPEGAYRLRRQDFYLPYLVLVAPGAGDARLTQPPAGTPADRARQAAGYGYGALATLAFEPDDLQAIVDAAACARELGDPLLALEATRALRKLSADLPLGLTDGDAPSTGAPTTGVPSAGVPSTGVPHVRRDGGQHEAATFALLAEAVQRRKRVRFTYHTFSRDAVEARDVEPWGLFFVAGHWYLAARDVDAGALRNFRLSRISGPVRNSAKPLTADFDVPGDFRLRAHATSREAWELGDEPPCLVTIRVRDGAQWTTTTREVRRLEPFVRWLLAFGGDAIPVAPSAVVDAMREALDRLDGALVAAAARGDASGERVHAAPPTPRPAARPPRVTDTAAAQLRRLMQCLPHLTTGDECRIDELVARVGTDADTLRHDVFALVARYDAPGGFVDGVQLFLDQQHISAVSPHFRRPMRLVASELGAILLGLSVLRHLRTPDEYAALERTRARLERVIAQVGDDPLPEWFAASIGTGANLAMAATVRRALQHREVLALHYHKVGKTAVEERVVEPYAIIASGDRLYLFAHCRRADDLRLFRLDRVVDARATGESYRMPEGFSVDALLERGRVFMQGAHDTLVVRYSPRIARWIAEREGVRTADDGSLTLTHPLGDEAWAIRHVMQYAGDAEPLAPPAVRERIGECVVALRAALAASGD